MLRVAARRARLLVPAPRLYSAPAAAPFAFNADASHQKTLSRSAQARYNLQIMSEADSGKLSNCLAIAAQMKIAGVNPDITTYNALLSAASKAGLWLEAWAILDDMLLVGVQPTVKSFNFLIRAQRFKVSPFLWRVVEKMNQLGVQPNAATFTQVIQRFAQAGNLELSLQYLYAMKSRNIIPELNAAQSVITLAARMGFPRLALDLAKWFEASSVRRIEPAVWMECLISSAESLYVDGVNQCWKTVVQDLKVTPDEGLCLSVLHTAARHGLPELGTDVLRVLKLMGAPWKEHHFAPLIEAFCRNNQLREALTTLSLMRTSDVEPTTQTAHPILTSINHDVDALDTTWSLIDSLHKEGTSVDVSALKVIIQASLAFGDLQRAVGTYKSYPEYGVNPDVETFNLLFDGCISAGHRELGDLLLADMKQAKIKPDYDTYEKMITLCLTQDTYEDAFFYLEEMKTAGHKPPLAIYEALVRKCFMTGDLRHQIALEELQEQGYEVSRQLRHEISDVRPSEQPFSQGLVEPAATEKVLDEATQKFIETGGLSSLDRVKN